MIGLIAATAAGRTGCDRIAAAWPDRTRRYDGAPVRDLLPVAFAECDQLVLFLATGAAVRLLAPLLAGKASDPAVVTVDEAHRHAVALLGGHAAGANALARAVSTVLTTAPVITTATDATGTPALDALPYPAEGAIPAVTRALLDGTPVHLRESAPWPLPPLPTLPPPGESRPAGTTERFFAAAPPAPAGEPHPATALERPAPEPAATAGRETVQPGGARPRPVNGSSALPDGTTALPADAAETEGRDPASVLERASPCPAAAAGRGTTQPGGAQPTPADGRSAQPGRTAERPATGAERETPPTAGEPVAPDSGKAEAAAPTAGAHVVWVTDRVVDTDDRTVLVRPPALVVGVGASRGVGAQEVLGLVLACLAAEGLAEGSVWRLATVDTKADEAGIVDAATQLGVKLETFGAAALADVAVPNPSAAPLAAVGTPSVAEAAALLAAGPGGELVVEKRKSAMATVAVARRRPRGRLAVVGLGPGARDLLTPRATAELRRASVVVGLDQYVAQIRDLLLPGTRVLESGLGAEEERARTAVAEARAGHAVALVGSGDAGVYAMASPALAEAADDIDVVGVPGVTAALAAASLLGAPLGHDHVSISLSDLHTPWEVIERRVRAAAEADLVVTFYNPRSRGRDWQLPKALALLAEHRGPGTPVGVVRAASRPDEEVTVTTLAAVDPAAVDMVSVVTVGNTASRIVAGRMVTPRGYRWQAAAPDREGGSA